MSIKIKKINIHGFRGIPELELEPEGKSLLLRGENGTGKSSIVEAIEFFFTGKVSHLEGVQGLSLRRHGPHINCTPDDINVSITFDPGNISLTRTFTSSPFPPAPLEDYFRITQKGTFILRRSQILEFITSQPAERFRAIGSIIGIESLDNIELEMMRLRDELEGKVASKGKEINRLINELSNLIGKEIKDVNDVLPTLNETLQRANLPLIKSFEEVDKHAQEMMKAAKRAESIDKVGALNDILKITNIPFVSREVVADLEGINEKVKYLLQDKARTELSIAELLETGRRFIQQEKMNICPLCEQEIEREKLLPRIVERLRILQGLSDKASEIRKISTPIIDNLSGISNNIKFTISNIESFNELSEEKELLMDKSRFLNGFIDNVVSAKEIKNEIPIKEFIQQKDEINAIRISISKKCSNLLSDIGLSEDEKKVLEVIRLIEQARSKVKDISDISSELKVYQKYYELAKKIYSTFSATKKVKIQEVYNAIQKDMQNFYSILHPNEPHKNIEIVVALGRRASTEMKIESFGRKGEDPRALTSEGHLDSLGLCIFLAFVKKFNVDCSLIVLDDVVTTIDASHRENICKLLIEKFREKQLIITTHDGIWYEQLRASHQAHGVEGNFKNLVIIGWNVDTGPIVRPYKARWERIQEKTAAGDKSGAGNEARQYLEWILETICEALQIPVPFKSSGRYEVRELLMPAKKRVDSLIKENTFKAEISKTFQNLDSTMIMGNLLSHNNILVENVSIEEVKGFCDSVRKLHNIFLCPECGHFVSYYRDLKIIRCSNPKCKKPLEVKTN
jgi:DNA repair exonuclease SbcCD ATPase subunit